MAEKTATVSQTDEPKAIPHKNLFSFVPKVDIKIPFFVREPKGAAKVKEEAKPKTPIVDGESESGSDRKEPSVGRVSFPNVVSKFPEPLEFEAEQGVGKTSNPVVLWQVYALGGFLVLRWVWARWKERQERGAKKESSDDNQPPADDEDSYFA